MLEENKVDAEKWSNTHTHTHDFAVSELMMPPSLVRVHPQFIWNTLYNVCENIRG